MWILVNAADLTVNYASDHPVDTSLLSLENVMVVEFPDQTVYQAFEVGRPLSEYKYDPETNSIMLYADSIPLFKFAQIRLDELKSGLKKRIDDGVILLRDGRSVRYPGRITDQINLQRKVGLGKDATLHFYVGTDPYIEDHTPEELLAVWGALEQRVEFLRNEYAKLLMRLDALVKSGKTFSEARGEFDSISWESINV